MFEDFRADPIAHPLSDLTGRIEIASATIESFGYDDCPGHPTWIEPVERLGGPVAERFPLALVANQPSTRLHGQLDGGGHSRAGKVGGREPIRIHRSTPLADRRR
jgi:biotin/methionine sulfoxide reductase